MRYQLLIVDTCAGIGRSTLALTSIADDVVVVTTPEPTAMTDAYAMIKLIVRQQLENKSRLNLIVNMAADAMSGRRVADRMVEVTRKFLKRNLRYLGTMVGDPSVGKAVASRTPFVLKFPESPAALCVKQIAEVLFKPGRRHRRHPWLRRSA